MKSNNVKLTSAAKLQKQMERREDRRVALIQLRAENRCVICGKPRTPNDMVYKTQCVECAQKDRIRKRIKQGYKGLPNKGRPTKEKVTDECLSLTELS